MPLNADEAALLDLHEARLAATDHHDELMLRYYQGLQRIEQLGMAIPPEMRRFLVVANWPRVVVDTINSRQQVRSITTDGAEVPVDWAQLPAQVSMLNVCRMVYGRGVVSVGWNEDDPGTPLVRAESPREVSVVSDSRTGYATSGARFYLDPDPRWGPGSDVVDPRRRRAVLYLPDATVWCDHDGSQWVEVDRDTHRTGRPLVVQHTNRQLPGVGHGESQMSDVIPFTDAVARSLTNMQFAQEAHGIPRMWMSGVGRGDFVDADGKPIPQFQAYFDAIHMLTDAAARVGQLDAADLKNFQTAMEVYGTQASIVTGFPARYFGLHPANPPSEGAIYADESMLTRSIEQQNEDVGVTLSSVGALVDRVATGLWPRSPVTVSWHDPATPTVSQREDALSKRMSSGVLSREGYWDELGWDEERKARERAYLAAERAEADPYAELLAARTAAQPEALTSAGADAPASS